MHNAPGAPASGPASLSQHPQPAGSETGAPHIAIAGCGVISAAGPNTDALLTALRQNTSCLRPNECFTGARFQSNIVGTAPIDAPYHGDFARPPWSRSLHHQSQH